MKKVMNYQVLIEILCCTFFALILNYLITSLRYQNYVTPKMIPYFYFSGIIMFIWAEASVFRLFKPQYKFKVFHCYVLIIPILILLFLNNSSVYSDFLSRYNTDEITQDIVHNHTHGPIEISGLDTLNNAIFVNDDEWSQWLYELSSNGEKYAGYTIKIKGFVFRDNSKMKDDEFLICRLQMSCCAQDLTLTGIMVKYEKAKDLVLNQWVDVVGKIEINENDLYIYATKVSPAEKPVNEYVYPVE